MLYHLEIHIFSAKNDPHKRIKPDFLHHSLDMQQCSTCFQMVGNTLTWVSAIPVDIIKSRKIEFQVVAFQVNDNQKEARQKIIITFPGDELNPKFTQSEYQATLKQVKISVCP